MKTCCICRATFKPAKCYGEACPTCEPVWQTCCTSVEEAVRYQVPQLSAEAAERCLAYEHKRCKRRVLITALERRLRKLADLKEHPRRNGGAA